MSHSLFREIWNRRSLVVLFAFNDVKLRYRNSVLGFLWTFLEPLLMLTVLYLVFTNIFKGGIPDYPLYLLLSLIIWYMFQRATTMGQTSLLDKAGIIQKVYFRREIVVISSCLTAFIMMGFEFGAFLIFVLAFKFIPPITILLLPLLLIDLFIVSLGVSLFLSSMTVYFRDLKFIWQVILQAFFFISPIIYRLNMFPNNIKILLQLNPLVALFDIAHGIALYNTLPTLKETLYLIVSTGIIFVVGYVVFKLKSKKLIEAL
jgi:lipopolysaccharide transport system permease protein